jgi:NADH:ubiquinone oxidoreductase subunit E
MITVTVCVGSSCHVRGARNVIELFKDLIATRSLQDKVRLKGCFCMDRCTEGVNLNIDGEVMSARTVEEARELFDRHVQMKLSEAPPDASGGDRLPNVR